MGMWSRARLDRRTPAASETRSRADLFRGQQPCRGLRQAGSLRSSRTGSGLLARYSAVTLAHPAAAAIDRVDERLLAGLRDTAEADGA